MTDDQILFVFTLLFIVTLRIGCIVFRDTDDAGAN